MNGKKRSGKDRPLHDLRRLKLSRTYYEGRWRIAHSIRRNGDLYPTHGLGPVCQWMDVNRGNRLESLVSVATKSRGLSLWAALDQVCLNAPDATLWNAASGVTRASRASQARATDGPRERVVFRNSQRRS